jgi:hypothetical protein
MSRRKEKLEGGRKCTNSLAAPGDEGQRAVAEKPGLHKSAAVPHRSVNNINSNHPQNSPTMGDVGGERGWQSVSTGWARRTRWFRRERAIGAPARPKSRPSENSRFGVRRTLGPLCCSTATGNRTSSARIIVSSTALSAFYKTLTVGSNT